MYLAAALAGVVANVYKQNMIFPAPQSAGGENKNQSGCCMSVLAAISMCHLRLVISGMH